MKKIHVIANIVSQPWRTRTAVRPALVILLGIAFAQSALGAEAGYKIRQPTKGGLTGQPIITLMTSSNQNVTINWHGLQGPYQVERRIGLLTGNWEPVGPADNTLSLTLPLQGDLGFFRVGGKSPFFTGASTCFDCHPSKHESWQQTAHAGAFETLKGINQHKNASCLPCHTLGGGFPTGFKDEAATPDFAGVQCENCHGPAGDHASNPSDLSKRPIIELSAMVCGGCHTEAHHPTYDEWTTSGHGSLEIPHEEFADPTTGPPRMGTCGACHSGATRLALMKEVKKHPKPADFKPGFPSTEEAAGTAIVCATCHSVHEKTAHPAQLHFPLASKVQYSYLTSTNFAANYNPQVQICAQCHNMRGASWTSTSRPPHHSPQYNMLIGKGGYEAGITNILQSAHMDVENQCAHCHTHAHAPDEITEQTPAYTGHDYRPTLKGCLPCHDEVGGGLLQEVVQTDTKQRIAEIKALLDQWALTKAPEALRTKYGVVAWEFTNIGQLSPRPTGVTSGPASAEQATIPDNIKQARFNLYLVEHDASYGVHNGMYARFLLKVARDKVKAEL